MVGTYKKIASGVKLDRAERRKILALAQRREIDVVLVTELSRWGRSTTDLLATLKELEARRVSLVALNGMAFDLATPHGRMMATLPTGIAEFEHELTVGRIRSGIAAAKARGKKLGRQPGQRPKSDRLAPKVMALVEQGRSYRVIGRKVGPRTPNETSSGALRATWPNLSFRTICGRRSRRCYRLSRRSPGAADRACRTGRHSPAPCSCCAPACLGRCCPPRWAAGRA